MKLQTLFDKLLEKAEIPAEKRGAILEKSANLLSQELPEEATEIVAAIDNFLTEQSALANRKISEQVYNKKLRELNKALKTKLQNFGFESNEIEDIISAKNIEEAFEGFGKRLEDKLKKHYSLSESERIKQEEELRRQEREKAERLQNQILELERRYKNELERERALLRLQYLIAQTPKNDSLPNDKANKLIINEIQEMLKRDNAKLVEVNGHLRVVNAEDESLDVFDDKNVRVTIDDYIRRAIKEARLEPKEKPLGKASTYFQTDYSAAKPNSALNFLKSFVNNKK